MFHYLSTSLLLISLNRSCLSHQAQYTASDAGETGLHILHLRFAAHQETEERSLCQRPESFSIKRQKCVQIVLPNKLTNLSCTVSSKAQAQPQTKLMP